MNSNHYVAIMAGGIGSRFWPASRSSMPKQFLDILGVGKSLIRLTFERFLELCPAKNIYVVTNKQYRELVKEHLPELSYDQILCEPSRNNTAPSVAYTAFKLHAVNPEANFVMAPSDHVILKEREFIDRLKQALDYTEANDALVTLGIEPTRPDTGYGYINYDKASNENGVFSVNRFTEKPDLENAKAFVASGDYVWNAGIFVWKTKNILASFRKNAEEVYNILKQGEGTYNTEKEQTFIDEYYPTTPDISVDYAIMEKADNIHTIPADIGWTDLGTWGSLYAFRDKDDKGNVVDGKVELLDTTNCLVRTQADRLSIFKGLNDYIIIDEKDTLLVFPKSEEQQIKPLVKNLKEKGIIKE